MVIGNGMIANRFSDYREDSDTVIFASGVSNSKDTVEEHFTRESRLLEQTLQQYPGKVFVYFSTCSVEDPDLASAPYVIHKKKTEAFIRNHVSNYYLFRISNLAGTSNNPYTLLNYFIFNILGNQPLTIWKNAYRNIIGVDDMFQLINYFLQQKVNRNTTINIANMANYPVPYIIATVEDHLGKKALATVVDRGDDYKIDVSATASLFGQLGIRFDSQYLSSLLKKYYHSK